MERKNKSSLNLLGGIFFFSDEFPKARFPAAAARQDCVCELCKKKTLEDLPQEGAKERGLSMLLLQELNLFALNALVRKQKKKKKKEYCL